MTWDELADSARFAFYAGKSSRFQPRALEVQVNPNECFTGIVALNHGDELVASFESRREGEAPRKVLQAANKGAGTHKMQAKSAYVVLFPSTLLAETGDNELEPVEGNWEIISLNASPTKKDTPIDPDTLMHNHFGSDGGTATGLSDAAFVKALRESFRFWQDKAMLANLEPTVVEVEE
tara:strand:+ start:1870 stop:2406 length:537 start_codon:yes stop_codon:yes gene_type:complete